MHMEFSIRFLLGGKEKEKLSTTNIHTEGEKKIFFNKH